MLVAYDAREGQWGSVRDTWNQNDANPGSFQQEFVFVVFNWRSEDEPRTSYESLLHETPSLGFLLEDVPGHRSHEV